MADDAADLPSPLAGRRVVEVADETGEFAGKLLADLGAEVVKVEPPTGSPSRTIPPFYQDAPDPERSLYFWYYNTNKRSVTLDLRSGADRAHFGRLLASADVLLESLPVGSWDAFGLPLAGLAEAFPRLCIASVSPFGQTGPYARYRSSDSVACALGGMTYVNGYPDGPPLRPFGPQAAHCAGFAAAIGILAALVARERTGRGQRIDISTQEAVLTAVEHVGPKFLDEGVVPTRQGTLHWAGGTRLSRARDGYVLLSLYGDWEALVYWLDHEGSAADLLDPKYRDPEQRRLAADHIFDVLDRWVARHDRAELIEGAQARRIPFAPVLDLDEVLSHPHLNARGFFVSVEQPELGISVTYPGSPIRLTGTPAPPLRRAPRLGEHTAEVLGELDAQSSFAEATGSPSEVRRRPHPNPLPQDEGIFLARDRDAGPAGGSGRAGEGSDLNYTPAATAPGALAGLRIADFTWVVAGPHATRILGDLGAEVIKIERLPEPGVAPSAIRRRFDFWGNLNRSKYSVALDLTRPEGLDLARRIIAQSDVVIENFSARVMANFGLHYEALRALRPDLVMVSLAGPGHSGPMKDYVTFGPTIHALSGHTALLAEPDGPPAGYGFSYADLIGGFAGAFAILAALRHRRRTGQGQFVDLAQWEACAASIGPAWLDLTANGRRATPRGNLSPDRPAAPDGVYPCAGTDRWCAITCRTETEWISLRTALGEPAWATEPRFATLEQRLAHRAELDRRLAEWTRAQPAKAVMERLQAAGVPAGLVQDARDLVERDPQLRHRRHWLTFTDPAEGEGRLEALPIRLSDTPARVSRLAPYPGEDADFILQDLLGVSADHLAELRRRRLVG